nr:MAG TPA: hypothetical protein [Caudoviricetes sp.]
MIQKIQLLLLQLHQYRYQAVQIYFLYQHLPTFQLWYYLFLKLVRFF